MTGPGYLHPSPSLVWSGSEYADYGIAWSDASDANLEIFFACFSTTGEIIGDEVRVTNAAGNSESPSLVWTGSEYGVVWHDSRDGNAEIYFARLSGTCLRVGSEVRVTSAPESSQSPSVVWAGSEYGVAWNDNRDGGWDIYFARLAESGERIGREVHVTSSESDSRGASLVWTGREYGLAWSDDRDGNSEIYFTRLSETGDRIGDEVRVTRAADDSLYPSLVWTGSEYGIAWSDSRDSILPETYFARLTVTGEKIGDDVRIRRRMGGCFHPSLAWTGIEYGIAWERSDEILFTRLSGAGDPVGTSEVWSISTAGPSRKPSLAWTGSEYGVIWADRRHDEGEVYFRRIGCP